MWNTLTDSIPSNILLAGVLVTGSVYLVTPEVTRRLAAKQALKDCMQGKIAAPTERFDLDINRQIAAGALNLLGEALKGTPAGDQSRALGQRLKGHRGSATSQAEKCLCLVEAAAKDASVRTETMVWILTFRLVEDASVSNVAGELARKDRAGVCGKEASP